MWGKTDANMIAADKHYSDYQTDEYIAQDIYDGMSYEEIEEIAYEIEVDIVDAEGKDIRDGLDEVFAYVVKNIDLYRQEPEEY